MRRAHRRHAILFGDFTENMNHGCEGGEYPSVAPTPQKRGPRRPHRIGRRGRLPSCQATPRREIVTYLLYCRCKYFLIAVTLFILPRRGLEL